MPLHCVFVLNLQAKVLYTRYEYLSHSSTVRTSARLHAYVHSSSSPFFVGLNENRYYDPACLRDADERRQWERVLYRNARPLFKDALAGPQFFEEGPVAVAFCIVNDLVLLVAGTDECDALLCTWVREQGVGWRRRLCSFNLVTRRSLSFHDRQCWSSCSPCESFCSWPVISMLRVRARVPRETRPPSCMRTAMGSGAVWWTRWFPRAGSSSGWMRT